MVKREKVKEIGTFAPGTKNTMYFRSKNGATDIHAMSWIPEGEPRGIVQIIHGMIEHIGRYEDFAEFLRSKGYIVAGHDHLGHG